MTPKLGLLDRLKRRQPIIRIPLFNKGTTTKVTSVQGTNLTITKTENVIEPDRRSLSNISLDSASTGSFVSGTTATTRTSCLDVADRPCTTTAGHSGIRGFEVSEGFGQDLVDKVRGR